jgi:hypothetical protein
MEEEKFVEDSTTLFSDATDAERQMLELQRVRIHDCITSIATNNQAYEFIPGFELLIKLIQNIVSNPGDEMYRIFKRSNKYIEAKLMKLKPLQAVNDLIESLGFLPSFNFDGNSTFVGDDFRGLM